MADPVRDPRSAETARPAGTQARSTAVLPWVGALVLALGLALVAVERLNARRPSALPGGLVALAARDLDTAAAAFDRAMRSEPPLADRAAFDLGVTQVAQRRYGDAITAFARAADLARDDAVRASAHYNRGLVLATLGVLPQSLAAFQQALRVAPGHERARINYAIVRARLDRDAASRATDPAADLERDRERQIQQTPDQVYGFTSGRRATRPVRSATDW